MQQHIGSYRVLTVDSNGDTFVSDEVLDTADGFDHLSIARMLHVCSSWAVEPCDCGLGFTARKGVLQRVIHLLPEESGIEDIALALGLLAPASRADGELEVAL